ncbi:MAG TPA: cell division protein FtsL [Gaiellaceae bacterium]|nr:cell division protein FtsL [Gaiellaceae bacterium]
MSSIAQSTPVGRVRKKKRAAAKPRLLSGGVVWIVFFAVLLSGVVAVNVAVLRLNLERDRVSSDRTQLQADISRLRSQLSTAEATTRVEAKAQKDLGLVPADPNKTVYVRLPR